METKPRNIFVNLKIFGQSNQEHEILWLEQHLVINTNINSNILSNYRKHEKLTHKEFWIFTPVMMFV